jgi:hypothetical protein
MTLGQLSKQVDGKEPKTVLSERKISLLQKKQILTV